MQEEKLENVYTCAESISWHESTPGQIIRKKKKKKMYTVEWGYKMLASL